MKKYKPWKIIQMLLMIEFGGFLFAYLMYHKGDLFASIIMFSLSGLLFLFNFILLFAFVSFHDDFVTIKHGYFIAKYGENPYTRKESWTSLFVKRNIYYRDIENIQLSSDRKNILIMLMNEDRILISFLGYFKNKEMMDNLNQRFNEFKNMK